MRTRIEAIQQLKPPTNVKGCRSFARMVNFVSIFCPQLQKLLKPIYELTKKGRHFIWGKEQQEAFDEIKARLQKSPVLSMPDKRGRFTLYSGMSKHTTGSALYQVQDGSPKLIAYVSKRMPDAAKNYSITELEMCGLAINIASFAHPLKRVDFDAVVDYLAIVHIMKSKAEPATNRIKRLLEILSAYSFNLYYIKGKDMILSDFLSRQHGDNSNPHEIIPISFNMGKILQQNYQNYTKTFLVQSRSQSKTKNTKTPDTCSGVKLIGKSKRKEIKPIIIDDEPTIIDLDTKTGIDTQMQDAAVTKTPDNSIRQGNRDILYPDQTARPLPKPPELIDLRAESK